MAIEYSLELNGVDADQISVLLTHVATTTGLASHELNVGGSGAVLDSGVLVVASAATPLPFPDPVEQELGVRPTVHVLFRFDKDTDPAKQRQDMVRLASAVLREIEGDVLLTFAGEIVWLLRKDGRLTISDRDDFWTPDILSLLPPDYERANLPVV
jgi:hypothetical protein